MDTNSTISECRLCVEIADYKSSLFSRTYPTIIERNSFFENSRLQVMIPIGPLCVMHLLIVSKEHILSFGHLGKDIVSDLLELVEHVSRLIRNSMGKERILVFEHGPLNYIQRGGSCLDHAHMNILPIPREFDMLGKASKYLSFIPANYYELEKLIHQNKPYLFFHCSEEGSFAAEAPIGSTQFFRKLLVSTVPKGCWDWRLDPRTDLVHSTTNILKTFHKT